MESEVQKKKQQKTAAEALELIKEGNRRYVAGEIDQSVFSIDRRQVTSSKGQNPFAVIVGCSDSRVPLEAVFNHGIGDLFIIRTAGNLTGNFTLASLEFAIGILNVPLLLVLGHTECGAVKAAINPPEFSTNSIDDLLATIRLSVQEVRRREPGISGDRLIHEAVMENARHSLKRVIERSALIRSRIESGRLEAMHTILDLASGEVEW